MPHAVLLDRNILLATNGLPLIITGTGRSAAVRGGNR